MPTVLCRLKAGNQEGIVRALLDTGSAINLLSRHVSKTLGLVGKTTTLTVSLAGGEEKTSKELKAAVELRPLDDNDPYSLTIICHTMKRVLEPLPPVRLDPKHHDELRGIKFVENFPQKQENQVDLILDEEATFEIMKGQIVRDKHGPKAIETELGFVLAGGYERPEKAWPIAAAKPVVIPNYEAFMNLEDLGVVEKDTQFSAEDQEAVEMMKRITSYDAQAKRYTTGLLWKKDPSKCLDDNFNVAKQVALAAQKRCEKLGYTKQVNEAYEEQMKLGHAERVQVAENPEHPVYHIPTHPVFKPGALTTKTRIVMNASSKCRSTGMSLNDCLYQGPTLLPDLVKILLRFRTHKYVVVSDISKMFWKIKIDLPDADCLRFCWKWESNGRVEIYRALSVTFGVVSAPFQAIWTIMYHAEKFADQFPLAAKAIQCATAKRAHFY